MEVSFSDRLSTILALTSALQTAGTEVEAAQAEARRLEEELYEKANSPEDYRLFCDGILATVELGATGQCPAEAIDMPTDEILNLEGEEVGDYTHSTFHKDGQMSTIVKAKKKSPPHNIVALKLSTPSSMTAPHNSEREARILVESRHENIVPLLDSFWRPGGRFVLVFPFLRQDLENLLRSGVLTTRQTLLVFDGMFKGLAHVHSLGIIHRDVKPSNILLETMDGPVYLADFGIAWSPNDPNSEPASFKITDVGSTSYRPPELLFGQRAYDSSLDMWAAGCVVAEMVKPDHRPLFDAGPLGSELGLIKSIFSTLGTPTTETWPSAKEYPDWGKMRFQDFPARNWVDILSGTASAAINLVRRTVCYESTARLSAKEALEHGLTGQEHS